MKAKHRKTLEKIFNKPIPANIKWNDVESMIVSQGGEIEKGRSGSRVGISLNNKVTVFHRPHPHKEMDKNAVKSLREFLKLAGVV